jgi:hypothetical protein
LRHTVNQGQGVLDRLRAHLAATPAGSITDTTVLEGRLADCWEDLAGDRGAMRGEKLFRRMESVNWQPPKLAFVIERHGGTVAGSTRAELQHWEIDLEKGEASLVRSGRRQLYQMSSRVDVKPLAESALAALRSGAASELVLKRKDGTFSVNTGHIFPQNSAVKATLAGRRKRLCNVVADALLAEGWRRVETNRFQPPPKAPEPTSSVADE